MPSFHSDALLQHLPSYLVHGCHINLANVYFSAIHFSSQKLLEVVLLSLELKFPSVGFKDLAAVYFMNSAVLTVLLTAPGR